jgi:hypothetical protein
LFDPQEVFCYWDTPDYALQDPRFAQHLLYQNDPADVSTKGGGFWFHESVLFCATLWTCTRCFVYTDVDRIDLGSFRAMLETMQNRNDDLAVDIIGNTVDSSVTAPR